MSTSTRYIVIALVFGGVVAFLTPYILQPEGWPLPARRSRPSWSTWRRRARGAHRSFAAPRPRVGSSARPRAAARPARESVSPRPARHGLTSVAVGGEPQTAGSGGVLAYA